MKGLYIHIPFCVQKCRYCDFVSYTGGNELFGIYIETLLNEAKEYSGEKIDTVFVGGGTPTVLEAEDIKRLLKGLHTIFDISPYVEFSVEGNPGTINDEKISALADGGVNRMSIGVQSFNNAELARIGRIHSAETAYNTVCKIKENGIDNINIDIMTALPEQKLDNLKSTLQTAVKLPITHISAYSLIIEDGTPMERDYSAGKIILPNDNDDREMYWYAVEFLKKHGFLQYEISNFAKPGFECRHNIKYWDCDEYIGLGVAAHSYIGSSRFSNSEDIGEYMNDNKRTVSRLSRDDEISEFMIMGLRKKAGIDKKQFFQRFGTDIEQIFEGQLARFTDSGLLVYENERYRLSDRGIDVSNSVMCEFIIKDMNNC